MPLCTATTKDVHRKAHKAEKAVYWDYAHLLASAARAFYEQTVGTINGPLHNLPHHPIRHRLTTPGYDPSLDMIEAERTRIGRELHDAVGQLLAAMKLRLTSLQAEPRMEEIATDLDEVVGLLNLTMVEVSNLARRLAPPDLTERGLVSALRLLLGTFERSSNIEADLVVSGMDESERLPGPVEVGLYRIAQEALSNAARHSNAGHTALVLWKSHQTVRLVISDDGQGFDPAKLTEQDNPLGLGLGSARARTRQLCGVYRLDTSPGNGTMVSVEVPLSPSTDTGSKL